MLSNSIATFAGGCFWGMQKWYKKQFGDSIIKSAVGYIGGSISNPNYQMVCTGETGYAEALQIVFDPTKTSYEALCEYFFRIHDPTQLNRQAGDVGTQYRSAIFVHDDEQKSIAEKVLRKMNEERYIGKIVTAIEMINPKKFINAEDYHQNYLEKNVGGYCSHKPRW